jgi:hypothetical protein
LITNKSIEKQLGKLIYFIRELKLLIILDDCDKIYTEDYDSFKEAIVNILDKVQGLKIMITSKVAMSDSVSVSEWIYKIRGLSRINALKLIKAKSPPNTEYKSELKELMKNCGKEKVVDHPLFMMLNGHPLSIIILSSLRVEMSLQEIYELLK